jgi:hypothetical protein
MHTLSPKDDIMLILYYQKKGPHLKSTIERFFAHKEAAPDTELNKQIIFPNKIFDTILNIKTTTPSTPTHHTKPPLPTIPLSDQYSSNIHRVQHKRRLEPTLYYQNTLHVQI